MQLKMMCVFSFLSRYGRGESFASQSVNKPFHRSVRKQKTPHKPATRRIPHHSYYSSSINNNTINTINTSINTTS